MYTTEEKRKTDAADSYSARVLTHSYSLSAYTNNRSKFFNIN